MDKTAATAATDSKKRWDWLPREMPGVARQLAERRRQDGDAWVNECWRRGVINREPGWFYAAEGALAVGVLIDHPDFIALACARVTSTQSFLMMKEKTSA